jgi:hypothetical protein
VYEAERHHCSPRTAHAAGLSDGNSSRLETKVGTPAQTDVVLLTERDPVGLDGSRHPDQTRRGLRARFLIRRPSFYDEHRAIDETRDQALRVLCNRLVDVLDGRLCTRTLYDENRARGHRATLTAENAARTFLGSTATQRTPP